MSYLAASSPEEFAVLIGGVVVMIGSLQWWTSHENADPGRVVARCADGSVIGERNRGVRRRAPRGPAAIRRAVREDLQRGDLAYLRVRSGEGSEAAWIVEGLDPDPAEPFRLHWEFMSAEDAIAAYRLIEERVLQPPLDETGHPRHLTDRDFDTLWTGGPLEDRPASENPGA